MLSLIEFCEALSISPATGRNWLKSGRLIPDTIIDGKPYFQEERLKEMLQSLMAQENGPLRSRRNKSRKSGSSLYIGYLPKEDSASVVEKIIASLPGEPLSIFSLRLILAEYALQLLYGARKIPGQAGGSLLLHYSQGKYLLGPYAPLFDDLIGNQPNWRERLSPLLPSLTHRIVYRHGLDFLGLLYLSLKDIGNRKNQGAYYTPYFVTDQMIRDLSAMENFSKKTVMDPACGTGNFLFKLACQSHNLRLLFGQDIDPIAVQIARINLACAQDIDDFSLLYRNITEGDSLHRLPREKYDVILGNPPWGAAFSKEEKALLSLRYQCARCRGGESSILFLEAALSYLPVGGILSFLLPQTILNITSYERVRALIAKNCTILSVAYLGNFFYHVHCPAVILTLQNTPSDGGGVIRISKGTQSFTINRSRQFNTASFTFGVTEDEMALLSHIEKVSPRTCLKDQADFAIGIVTGNNNKFVKKGPQPGGEMVLKGSHILQYRIAPSPYTIVFLPAHFQQLAGEEFYRAPQKLLYRFISNQLIFAYDNHQTLSLNSVNLLIPHIKNMSILYLLALLNSRVLQFYFSKRFDSVKVLRSHLEQLPLPIPSKTVHEDICRLALELINQEESTLRQHLYNQIEEQIVSLFALTPAQLLLLNSTAVSARLFL